MLEGIINTRPTSREVLRLGINTRVGTDTRVETRPRTSLSVGFVYMEVLKMVYCMVSLSVSSQYLCNSTGSRLDSVVTQFTNQNTYQVCRLQTEEQNIYIYIWPPSAEATIVRNIRFTPHQLPPLLCG